MSSYLRCSSLVSLPAADTLTGEGRCPRRGKHHREARSLVLCVLVNTVVSEDKV